VADLLPSETILETGPDGTQYARSPFPLGPYPTKLTERLDHWAAEAPDRTFLARRDAGGAWVHLSYGDMLRRTRAIAQSLIDRRLSSDRPVVILSGNSLEHALLGLAAMYAGIMYTPLAPAYALLARDYTTLRVLWQALRPGLVFAAEGALFERALTHVAADAEIVTCTPPAQLKATPFSALEAVRATAAVDEAHGRVGPDTVAKVLYTSGSTGRPKGVINTQRMLCANQAMLLQVMPLLGEEPPVLVDWLPWSHTFGANHNLGQVLAYGGTLHIDDGRPAPALFDRTVAALREVAATAYFNVPGGWALLAARLEADRALAETFFSRLRFMFYAAAALPPALWDRLRAVADEVAARPVPLTASWGSTETAPGATTAHFVTARCGCIGVPLPGVTLKLAPVDDKLELRVRGPNVTPGYHRDPAATAAVFDEDGFYRSGDAARLVDPDDPDAGLMFDGRLAENFKLVTGTWVVAGQVRTALISAAGVLTDAVIAGHDRDHVAALAWLNQGEARRVCGAPDGADVALDDPALRAHLAAALATLNAGQGSACRVERLLLLDTPPDMDAGEITDKGYVNQRAVLARRAEAVERLFAEAPDAAVIVAAG